MAVRVEDFATWLERWELTPDGAPFETLFGSRLLPVRRGLRAAMLKIAHHPEERRGGAVMAWYAGGGAAEVFAYDEVAVLLERLDGTKSLAAMARGGADEAACRILCETVAKLQAPRVEPPPRALIPLETWFHELWPAAKRRGGVYGKAAATARVLLATPGPSVVLHGDIHHDNVLHAGGRSWRAIDPKGLVGDRAYDYANLMCNPDAETALANFTRRLDVVAQMSGLDRRRALEWLLAYSGLSAAWTASIDGDPRNALAIGERAAAELGL